MHPPNHQVIGELENPRHFHGASSFTSYMIYKIHGDTYQPWYCEWKPISLVSCYHSSSSNTFQFDGMSVHRLRIARITSFQRFRGIIHRGKPMEKTQDLTVEIMVPIEDGHKIGSTPCFQTCPSYSIVKLCII